MVSDLIDWDKGFFRDFSFALHDGVQMDLGAPITSQNVHFPLVFGILPVRVLLMNRKMGWDPFCPFCLTHFEWTTRFLSALVRSSLLTYVFMSRLLASWPDFVFSRARPLVTLVPRYKVCFLLRKKVERGWYWKVTVQGYLDNSRWWKTHIVLFSACTQCYPYFQFISQFFFFFLLSKRVINSLTLFLINLLIS